MIVLVPVPAVSFTSPWMLAGLLLAAIPLLLHLLYRRRYQEVPWAAVQFLRSAVRKNAQKHRLQQLLLLLLRTAAILALVLAFARPLVTASLGPAGRTTRTHHVFVIDGSLSMQYRDGQTRRFDRAVSLVRELVETSPGADAFHVVRLDYGRPTLVIPQAAYDRTAVLRELDDLDCTAEREDVAAGLAELPQLVEQVSDTDQHTVYFVSDFQPASWDQSAGTTGQLPALLARLGNAAQLVCVNVNDESPENVAVQRIETDSRFVKLADTVTIRGVIRNGSRAAITDQPVRLVVDDRVVGTQSVSAPGQATVPIQFRHQFSAPGLHRVSLETDEDRLPHDNRARLVVRVFDRVPLLLVNGKTSGRPMGNATDFLKLSLEPDDRNGQWDGAYRTRVISEAELTNAQLEEYGAVFLCNIRRFTTAEIRRLAEYARSGGAVVICLGDQVEQQNYNTRLFGEDGLLSVRLDGMIGNAAEPRDAFLFETTVLDHPILSVYRGNPGHGLEQALTFQYVKVRPQPGDSVRTALSLTTGDPVIVESNYGDGRVVLVAIAGDDTKWSTWNTASGTYASLINEVSEFAISGQSDAARVTVGHPVDRRIGANADNLDPVATMDTGEGVPVRVESSPAGVSLVIDRVPREGYLELQYGADRASELLASNIDDGESDLRSLTQAALQEGAFAGVEFEYRSAELGLAGTPGTRSAAANDASFILILAALVFLLGEQLLASRARSGLWSALVIGLILFAAAAQPVWNDLTAIVLLALAATLLLVLLAARLRTSPR